MEMDHAPNCVTSMDLYPYLMPSHTVLAAWYLMTCPDDSDSPVSTMCGVFLLPGNGSQCLTLPLDLFRSSRHTFDESIPLVVPRRDVETVLRPYHHECLIFDHRIPERDHSQRLLIDSYRHWMTWVSVYQ